ncbi:MAG: hypothetical protein F6J94_24835, partial [Moorea sp. SIO1F2]|uniref:Tc toxin subunit A-related protein n=1 Tax=Moorena sp. SIO1F2 TaxID=2607819 RepID=UPI0013BDECD9
YGADSTNSDSGKGLLGYWPLKDNLKDEAGNHHGTFQSEGTIPTWVEAVNLPVNNDQALSLNSTTGENTKLEEEQTKLKQAQDRLNAAQDDEEKKEAEKAVNEAQEAVEKAQEAVEKAQNKQEYVKLPKASVLKLTDSDFTVEAWVNADELPERDVSILGTDSRETNEGLHLIIRNKKAYMGFFNNDLEGKTELKPGEWIYIVWRYRKYKAEQAIFINGVKDNFSEGHPAFKGDEPVLIGRWSTGKSDGNSTYFQGQIAEVKIWNKALEDEQISLNYSKYQPGDNNGKGEPILLTSGVSKSHSSVSSVKNQPGWFIFDNGDEAFLATTPKEAAIPLISDSLLEVQGENDTINLSYNKTVTLPKAQKFSFIRLTTSTIRSLSTKLLIGGIDKLLSLESQSLPELDFTRFQSEDSVITPQTSQLDFDGPYGMYFREIFFHIPFLVANTLNANQRFEEAQKWYHYIFNPTAQAENNQLHPSDRFWQYLPFRGNSTQKLEQLLRDNQAIAAYNNKPFDPHAIAQLRIGAYEKAIVMKYIDNILDWGDQLFTQDNRESIAQASILYLLAYDLLGEKPESLGKRPTPPPTTVEQIKKQYQASNIPQFLIELENSTHNPQTVTPPLSDINTYFCVSENKEFLKYWERVEDRLYKIRHSLSIEGVFRQLALFQPPIDPNQLVRAFAAGGTSATVLSQLSPTVPHYRFDYMLERARNMISTVIQLGSSLLSALEKKDAEELSLLRSTHEQVILQLITDTKEKQIEEAKETLNSLEKSKGNADERKTHYQKLYDENLNAPEITDLSLRALALLPQYTAISMHGLSVPGHLIPKIFGFSNGGMEPGDAAQAIARAADGTAGMLNQSAGLISTGAQYIRRREEWDLQKNLAEIDVQQIEYQIEAQKIRQAIAEQELKIHNKSIEQAKEIEDFLKDKFTNKELYQWMVGRLSSIYFPTYKIALDMAIAAQRAYQYELNQHDTFIEGPYWDSLHKGLLAGESLMLGLNQLEKAYIEGNVRRLEIEKTISLLQLNPKAFQQLKDTGKCEFKFSEKLFDFDFPGHYCRQIKTIAISIPAVVGPYQNINATLTQTSNKTLLKPDVQVVQFLLGETDEIPDTSILRSNWRRNQKIAISRGANDNGLFELNFRDERYLPFEGTGAVSTWELSLPKQTNRIDFDTISDVIITLSYTALDGGDKFRKDVTNLEPLQRYSEAYYFNVKQAFPGEWHTFMNLNTDRNSQKLTFPISSEIIPPHIEDAKLKQIWFKLDAPDVSSNQSFVNLKIANEEAIQIVFEVNNIAIVPNLDNEHFADNLVINFDLNNVPGNLKKDGLLNPEIVKTIELILIYEGKIDYSGF